MENRNGCVLKIQNSWKTFMSTLSLGHPIHPIEPLGPKYCDYIPLGLNCQLRVIHITPEKRKSVYIPSNFSVDTQYSKRNSLSEEYWFTKWNKPLKIRNCNCSFRRSLRYSALSNGSSNILQIQGNRQSISSYDIPPTRIINVETFIERLIEETLFEAFQEYFILTQEKSESNGKFNLAFEDCNEDNIVPRKKIFIDHSNSNNPIIHFNAESRSSRIKNQSIILQARGLSGPKMPCVHQYPTQNKPLIFLFHGIGSSADVWWLVINSLINKGFEVVVPDMLGHGYSSTPDKEKLYTFHNLLIQALTVFDHYIGNDSRKCTLIGHSYGCSIVTALYHARAPQVSQLILISGGGPTPLAPPVAGTEITPLGCIQTTLSPLLWCGLKRNLFYSSRGKNFTPTNENCGIPEHVLKYVIKGQNWPQGDAAFHRRILVPTLLIHGLQDKQVTLVQECEMERTVPRAFLELIPNAGHMAMLETPEHLSHMILCFLNWWS